jgi:hypothetical protein
MARIDNLPQDFLDEHTRWHHGGTGAADFLPYHADFVRRVLEWYGMERNNVWPWAEIPHRIRRIEGWDLNFPNLPTRTPSGDAALVENRRPFEIPEPLDAFAPAFASEQDLARFIWEGLHERFLHRAGSMAYGEPELADFHTSPRVTQFYQLHGMIEEWRQAFLRRAYRCGFPDNHAISVSIEQNAVSADAVEFVLQTAPWITWWKQIVIPNGLGGRFTLETKNDKHEDRNGLWAHELHNGQSLEFWAGGFFGLGRHVANLGNLHRLPPGSRITFRWVQDWHAD